MATIKRIEDIIAWQKARVLCKDLFDLWTNGNFKNDYGLWDQINRSSGSIMDNIAEGFEREGKKEFIQFLSYAKSSAGEVRSQLFRALDRNYIAESEFETLYSQTIEIAKMIGGLTVYLKSSDVKGLKYKT